MALRVSWFSNAPWSATGYGNQTKLFTGRIQGLGHEVGITAFYGLEGAILEVQGPRGLIPVYPKGNSLYGQDIWSAAAKHFGADVCISLMDAWVFDIDQNPHNVPWIPWFPVDSEPLAPRITQQVSRAHKRICFSKFGKRVVEEAGLDCYYVPHGVDTKTFRPIPQQKAREFLQLPQDKFIVGMVAANKGNPSRKAFTQNIEAFAEFHKTHPDALLYLHTARGERGEEGGVNLPEFCTYLGLEEGKDVLFADQYMYLLSLPDFHMANLYSSFDVHLLVSMGEGFGIPILEAQACGCPVIVGDWTSMSELCFGGWKVSKRDTVKVWNPLATYQWLPRPEAIAEKLEEAYKMRGVDSIRQRARKGALAYDADKVAEKYWKPALEDIEKSLSDKHRHKWHSVGVWSDDKTLSVPCVECGAELVLDERRVQKRVIPNGFKNSLDLKFCNPDGLEWILLREAEREYDTELDLDENSKVIDIGAHVGVISMYLAKKYGCEVWAIEPNKRNRDILLANIHENGLEDKVHRVPVAVTSDGRHVNISNEPRNSGGGNIFGDGERVASMKLEWIIEDSKAPVIDLLKIDCEGAEYEILADPEVLRGKVKAIRGEFHKSRGDAAALLEKVRAVVPDTKVVITE